jgi:hypothetical protein
MTTALEERIGGNLGYSLVRQVFEEMRQAPVSAFSRVLEHRKRNLAFEGLDLTGKEPAIGECLNAWLEVHIERAYWNRDNLRLKMNRMPGTWFELAGVSIDRCHQTSTARESVLQGLLYVVYEARRPPVYCKGGSQV